MKTIEITKDSFQETLKRNSIVFLDFWASWCGPCRMFGPIFEAVAAKNPDIVFGKVDTEREQELASAFQVRSIPTLMAFKDGVLLFSQPGVVPENALEEVVRQVRAVDVSQLQVEGPRNGR